MSFFSPHNRQAARVKRYGKNVHDILGLPRECSLEEQGDHLRRLLGPGVYSGQFAAQGAGSLPADPKPHHDDFGLVASDVKWGSVGRQLQIVLAESAAARVADENEAADAADAKTEAADAKTEAADSKTDTKTDSKTDDGDEAADGATKTEVIHRPVVPGNKIQLCIGNDGTIIDMFCADEPNLPLHGPVPPKLVANLEASIQKAQESGGAMPPHVETRLQLDTAALEKLQAGICPVVPSIMALMVETVGWAPVIGSEPSVFVEQMAGSFPWSRQDDPPEDTNIRWIFTPSDMKRISGMTTEQVVELTQ